MSEILYSPDKPKDCKYCYWYYKRKGCTYGDHCYYEVKPKEKESPCDGCAYGITSPCIGYCMSLFRAYSDWEIMGCGVFHNCTADDLREYWADLMTALLLPVLNDGWETSPRLEAYGDKTNALVEHHGDLFTEPAFILVNDVVDFIDDPSWSVEHNVQLWITDSGYLAIVHMFGVLNGSEYVGYYDFDYSVNEFSRIPWRFEKLLSKLFWLVENRHAW